MELPGYYRTSLRDEDPRSLLTPMPLTPPAKGGESEDPRPRRALALALWFYAPSYVVPAEAGIQGNSAKRVTGPRLRFGDMTTIPPPRPNHFYGS